MSFAKLNPNLYDGSMRLKSAFIIFLLSFFSISDAAMIKGNSTTFINPPAWLTENRIERVVDRIQRFLEWDIRRVTVNWYLNAGEFQAQHGFGPAVLAISKKPENLICLGPDVTNSNFDAVFGHELVHIILYQKYRDAIPKWLEEGLANYAARKGSVDYLWLKAQPFKSIRSLGHPFLDQSSSGKVGEDFRYHYQASTAVMEMIASKCRINDLLQLSVGEKLEGYLGTFCGVSNLDVEFKKWIQKKR